MKNRSLRCLLLLLCFPAPALAELTDGGFESSVMLGLPDAFAIWGGDPAAVTGAENGISPAEGSAMLRFDATQLNGAGAGTGGDLWQLVDATGHVGQIARVSARVNRVAGSAQTDTDFRVDIRAFAGDPLAFDDTEPVVPIALAIATDTLSSDADTAVWQTLEVELTIPSGTDYLGVLVSAVENIENDLVAPEFDGHYADGVVLTIAAPVPSIGEAGRLALALAILIGAYASHESFARRGRRKLIRS